MSSPLVASCGAPKVDHSAGGVEGKGSFGALADEAGEDAPMAADVLFPSADAVDGIHELKCGFL